MKNSISIVKDRSSFKSNKKKLLKYLAKDCPSFKIRVWLLRKCNYCIGSDVFIGRGIIVIDDEIGGPPNLIIEDRAAISPRVTLVLDSTPNESKLVSYGYSKVGKIIIENDAWIGTGSVILPNTTIGECAIVGANSLVNRNVASFTVAGGVPAKKINKVDVALGRKEQMAEAM